MGAVLGIWSFSLFRVLAVSLNLGLSYKDYGISGLQVCGSLETGEGCRRGVFGCLRGCVFVTFGFVFKDVLRLV